MQLITGEIRVGGMLPPLEDGAKLRVYEFSQATAPPRRHKIIKEFQDGASKGARCLVVTYATAAVGITYVRLQTSREMDVAISPNASGTLNAVRLWQAHRGQSHLSDGAVRRPRHRGAEPGAALSGSWLRVARGRS